MKDLIKSLLVEGKSDQEIAQAVISEDNSVKASDVVAQIVEAKKIEDAQKELKSISDAAAQDAKKEADKSEMQKAIDEGITDKLKSIAVNPTDKFAHAKELKRFNPVTGKTEGVRVSETKSAFNTMLGLLESRDLKSAKDISNQIDIENDHVEALSQGQIKATPSVSDVTTRGGYAIPTEVSDLSNQLTYDKSTMLPLVNKDSVIFESKIYPVMYGITVGYIADQSTAVTEKNPTFSNPSIAMERVGGYSAISNTILRQKGADLTAAFASSYSSALAEFLDLHIPCGNVTGASDLIDGIVFDANTNLPTPFALSALTLDKLKDVKNALDAKANMASTVFIANRKVADKIGLLESTGGAFTFPGFVSGAKIAPFGIPLVTNPQIPSVLDVGGDNRTGGTDDVLICADMSKVIVGLSGETRIDTSEHFLFSSDALTMRVIKSYGQKVISSTSTAGIVSVAQELTNV